MREGMDQEQQAGRAGTSPTASVLGERNGFVFSGLHKVGVR